MRTAISTLLILSVVGWTCMSFLIDNSSAEDDPIDTPSVVHVGGPQAALAAVCTNISDQLNSLTEIASLAVKVGKGDTSAPENRSKNSNRKCTDRLLMRSSLPETGKLERTNEKLPVAAALPHYQQLHRTAIATFLISFFLLWLKIVKFSCFRPRGSIDGNAPVFCLFNSPHWLKALLFANEGFSF